MAMTSTSHTVQEHFGKCSPAVTATYSRILEVAGNLGPFQQEAKKTSIHLVRKSAFAGIATRKTALILTLKSATDLTSKRIAKREQASANRWHIEVRLETPDQVDRELVSWLSSAYELAA
jgi:uncharacterized protein DUF5655